ncbi:hypothetical protein [Nonomuraea rhodomycinica]|uniref:Uncharacterized protein n=1 Tax=Nonomuraea rhodomycinica TaxID=1712872 RepID=A0A7Y6IMD8_9ACTN|nr:hypothetical protein [Nonomuraea rhodomycinica]NUW39579.1 hypothetical protein [Nonomuraea rhodomycinica]
MSSGYGYLLPHDVGTRNPLAGLTRPPVDRDHATTPPRHHAQPVARGG